ncbi:uncharacterized protein LOC136086438 [Hydra vulgaris]|uniref:Uncharacterized protein LOC136086438 n=1 Tax=Hydra vulgaris TaxID=6087 RepID=A0ABM4CSE4_HYDVU
MYFKYPLVQIPHCSAIQKSVTVSKLHVNYEKTTTEDECNKFDIGLFVDKVENLSKYEKYNLLMNVWVPPSDYIFPKTNGRKCNPVWQNIPLRGHRDDTKHLVEQYNNAGNFQCLSDLMALWGDKILSDHFKNGPKNATYRSKTVQNELINICAGVVRSLLTDRIKKAKFFFILADEVSDVSQTEYMAVIVQYMNECCKVKEDKIRQGYDGAGNMAGRLCGVAALILKDFPKAPYVHCFSHQLNLCDAKARAIPSIQDMMDHVRIVSDFFNNSPKRLEDLSTKINEQCPTSSFQKTINVSIVASLICIKEDVTWNYKPRGDTSAYVASSIDISHTKWYKEAVSIAATTSTMPSKPRTCGQQTQCDNHEVDDINKERRKKVKEFVRIYQNDLPEPSYFYAELDMWEVYWKNHSDSAPKTISDSLQKCDNHTFPNISTILRIFCTLPVTTCTCERSLSALKIIKTSLPNTMGMVV